MPAWPPLSPAPDGSLTHGATGKRRHRPEGYRVRAFGRLVKKRRAPVARGGIERPHQEPHEDDDNTSQSDGGPYATVEQDRHHLEHRRIQGHQSNDAEKSNSRNGAI